VADDLEWFRRLDLDMIGIGPWVAHDETPLGRIRGKREAARLTAQVPSGVLTTCKAVALARIVCPRANIPSTTALATVSRETGWELGLRRGANVIMINLTPAAYRALYEIYPAKACIGESAEEQRRRVALLLEGVRRRAGKGPGTSPNYRLRRQEAASPVGR
jgi:biotin synthase